jgi:hypothetical protein
VQKDDELYMRVVNVLEVDAGRADTERGEPIAILTIESMGEVEQPMMIRLRDVRTLAVRWPSSPSTRVAGHSALLTLNSCCPRTGRVSGSFAEAVTFGWLAGGGANCSKRNLPLSSI